MKVLKKRLAEYDNYCNLKGFLTLNFDGNFLLTILLRKLEHESS